MRSSTTATALAAWLVTGCASAPRNPVLDKYPPGVLGHTTITYYDVHGRTFAELHADMRRLGPKVGGESFVGETRSPMQWNWRNESSVGSTCTIRNLVVSVNAQILLPRWTPPADTEPGLAAEWNRFITALEVHEAGHKDISARAGSAIADQLRGLAGPCSMINSRANDIARVIADRANEEQKRYDAETHHGLTQGTTFGPRSAVMTIVDASAPLTLLARPRPGTVRGTLAMPLDRVWTSMAAAYAASTLSINAVDSASHAVGDSLTARGRVGSRMVSEVIDCGAPPAGWNADSVDVALFVTSRLDATPSGTTVTNTVQAIAHPERAEPVACRSRGVLERQIIDALRGQLAR